MQGFSFKADNFWYVEGCSHKCFRGALRFVGFALNLFIFPIALGFYDSIRHLFQGVLNP